MFFSEIFSYKRCLETQQLYMVLKGSKIKFLEQFSADVAAFIYKSKQNKMFIIKTIILNKNVKHV